MRERIQNPKISKYEEPLLSAIAIKTAPYLHPDIATAIAILSSVLAFYAYIKAPINPYYYLLATLAIFCHYLFDGIDGKIAKLRGMATPGNPQYRGYGWHIDKTADFVSSLFFISGFFWAITQKIPVTALHVGLFVAFYILYLRYCSKQQKDVVVGGTESRLVLIVLTLILFYLVPA